MEPTFRPGDLVVADFAWYRDRRIQRGDLVLFEGKGQAGSLWIMRCAAIQGDLVEVRDGTCWVNGNRQDGRMEKPSPTDASFGPRVLEDVEVFCLGDNLPNSYDSRFWGPLMAHEVRGKALFTLRRPQWDRGAPPVRS